MHPNVVCDLAHVCQLDGCAQRLRSSRRSSLRFIRKPVAENPTTGRLLMLLANNLKLSQAQNSIVSAGGKRTAEFGRGPSATEIHPPNVCADRQLATGDNERLNHFMSDLLALERKSYEAAMRAIRRYVIGAHRISDDVNLAYALFVMSIESLAQEFDGFEPVWEDYDQSKRQRIDDALLEAPDMRGRAVVFQPTPTELLGVLSRTSASTDFSFARIRNRS
jgi:hypothetical protein